MSFYLKIDYLYLGLFFHYPLGLLSIDNLFFLFQFCSSILALSCPRAFLMILLSFVDVIIRDEAEYDSTMEKQQMSKRARS